MHNPVSSKGEEESTEDDDQDTGKSRNVRVDCIKELSAHDGVCGGPADTGQDIENSNWTISQISEAIRRSKIALKGTH